MARIALLKYNNYYNRIIQSEGDTYEDYSNYIVVTYDNINFKPGDYIDTSLIINVAANMDGHFDYLLNIGENDKIISRWFITDKIRTREGQYNLTLHRDIIQDYYEEVIISPVFIEKATIPPDNNLIFNNENMTYNQIKTSETLLDDKTKTPWIIGYISAKQDEPMNGSFGYDPEADINLSTISHNNWEYAQYGESNPMKLIASPSYHIRFYYGPYTDKSYFYKNVSSSYCTASRESYADFLTGIIINQKNNYENLKEIDIRSWFNFETLFDSLKNLLNAKDNNDYEDLKAYDGKKVLFSDGLYRVNVYTRNFQMVTNRNIPSSSQLSLYLDNSISDNLRSVYGQGFEKYDPYYVTYGENYTYVTLTLIRTATSAYSYTIPTAAKRLLDAPYKMFAIPLYDKHVTLGNTSFNISREVNLAWSMSIPLITNIDLYDIQILPYCPLNLIDDEGTIRAVMTENVDYITLKNNNNNVGVMFFCESSNFTKFIDHNINIDDLKISNETDLYRLCSPNYSGVFEFSAAKNRGVDGFNAICTYKPYNPYVQVSPVFKAMYGNDFKDARGLICGGDFSLPIINDAFKTYELQNKNYQNIFDRQIQNIDVNNSVQRVNEIVSGISGTIAGGAAGVAGGLFSGGVPGAIVGGALGTTASAISGIADFALNEKLRKEAIDYTVDNFGYQLGNIKALPYTLSKVSSIIANSKFYPFLEYYTCTEEEKEALRNKLKYNGMTVMVIGKIEDYQQAEKTYIKGKLIRLEGEADTHETRAIAEELNKGVFI